MKVAYWPGCVSRGFTPELHGSMAKIAPMLEPHVDAPAAEQTETETATESPETESES